MKVCTPEDKQTPTPASALRISLESGDLELPLQRSGGVREPRNVWRALVSGGS